MSAEKKYTIVQHSGYGYGDDPQFKQGLEVRSVRPVDEEKITKVGGLLFDNWTEADTYAEEHPYGPDDTGLIPKAPGTFARTQVDGLRLYLPPKKGD